MAVMQQFMGVILVGTMAMGLGCGAQESSSGRPQVGTSPDEMGGGPGAAGSGAISGAGTGQAEGTPIDLNLGNQTAEMYTCDFSYDYVRINAEYTT